MTPLHLAAGEGHAKVVEFLISLGVDVAACAKVSYYQL